MQSIVLSPIRRWSRDKTLSFEWSPFDSIDKLVLTPHLRNRLKQISEPFLAGQDHFHKLQLCWRRGLFLYGPAGSGKTAASRALARALGWSHFTVPAHEILDSHFLERALADAIESSKQVIVLEDIDEMVRRMEPKVFFGILDHAMERADGTFWVATSRHAEDAPKTQLVRPGRFEESVRLDLPGSALRKELLTRLFQLDGQSLTPDETSIADLVERSEQMTFAHFEELRQVIARLRLESHDSQIFAGIQTYIDDQIIAGDRWGGLSDATDELNERVKNVDPRVLMASLDMSDVFRRLMEKVVTDSAQEAKKTQAETGTPT